MKPKRQRKTGVSMSCQVDVWQSSVELAEMSYRLSARFPRAERFGLTSRMRRSAASVLPTLRRVRAATASRSSCSSSGLPVDVGGDGGRIVSWRSTSGWQKRNRSGLY